MYDTIIIDVLDAFDKGEENPHGICIANNCPHWYEDSALCKGCDQ